jgi:hypothetical protein
VGLFDLLFLGVMGGALLALPRKWAVAPILIGTCLMTVGHVVLIGPFSFTALRLLIALGLARIVVRRETVARGPTTLDLLVMSWALWMCVSSAFHEQPTADLITKLGVAYDACGVYILLRALCREPEDVRRIAALTGLVLLPVACAMLFERISDRNIFAALGGVPETAMIRDGKLRAYGPFLHPILAGTVGAHAVCSMGSIWRNRRRVAWLGAISGAAMVLASNSSGPIMSTLTGLFALLCWRIRKQLRLLIWGAVVAYVALDIVMNEPAYFILSRIDLTGSSTGWHRAELIRSAFAHFGEWWFAGTDHTRHWMPTGVSWSGAHTDITNHYLKMGVMGGFGLTLLLVAMIVAAFRDISRLLARQTDDVFVTWTLGATLFCHATTFVAVSYFDQSIVFFYMTLACIASIGAGAAALPQPRPVKAAPAHWSRRAAIAPRAAVPTASAGSRRGPYTWQRNRADGSRSY